MGKYSNVDANGLMNAVTTALSEINSYDLQTVTKEFKNGSSISPTVRKDLSMAIESVRISKYISGSIMNLKDKLTNLKKAASYIVKYQQIERDIEYLEARKYKTTYDYKTGEREEKLDYSVVNQITRKEQTLREYEYKIDSLLI